MRKTLLFLALALSVGSVTAQKGSPWQKVGTGKLSGHQKVREGDIAENQRLYQVNQAEIEAALSGASDRFSGQPGIEISIPNAAGQMESFMVWENSNFEPALQAQFPNIRSYSGQGVTDRAAVLSMSVSPIGIQTMTVRADRKSEFIQPYTTDHSVYVLTDSATRAHGSLPWTCGTEDVALSQDLSRQANANRASNLSYKTMRLALSCTGEYATYFGGSQAQALAGMNATMTRVNGIMEKDLAIHLNIIAGNTAVIYINAATDPYSNADVGTATANVNNALGWNIQLQNTLTSVLGNGAYDIGHLFGATGGGGNAGCIGCVCVDDTTSTTDKNKGSGYTSPADGIPVGDNFDVDYVVHEMGHQLGANHTFSYANEGTGVNVEPGSGSTIMAYAGITGASDVQAHSDPYFTYRSILQIQTNMAGKTCPVSTAITNNTPPTISAGADFTIPKGTAFVLKGTGSDAQGDTITYCWEQNDSASASNDGFPSPTKTNGPNFRSFNPTTSPNRYMPAFSSVLDGNVTTMWETVSNVARTMNFTLTGRDSHDATSSQTQTDAMIVTTNATAGPFQITYPNTTNETWLPGETRTVTWDVAGTTANGINTANVNILISLDGGATFTTWVANTPNDGTQAINVPTTSAPYCRILVEAVGNIYYAVSKSFAIGYNVVTTTTCNTYPGTVSTAAITGPDTQYQVQGSVTIPDDVIIGDLNLAVNITHTKVNDLYVGLVKPNSTTVDCQVYTQSCAAAITQNMVTTWDDEGATLACGTLGAGISYRPPNQLLSVFDGVQSAGLWRLAIADVTAANNGTLNSWSIQICSTTTTVSLATDNFDLIGFSLYPNPNNGSFSIKFTPDGTHEIGVTVHDIQGRSIFTKKYPATGAFEESLQLPSVQSGVYLVTVQNGASKTVKRIVVE